MEEKQDLSSQTNKDIVSFSKDGKVHSWMPYHEYVLWQEIAKRHTEYVTNCVLWGNCPEDTRSEEEKYKDHLKWAWVVRENEIKSLLWVHNENMKAYEDDRNYGVKEPLEEVSYKEFTRWATSFDL